MNKVDIRMAGWLSVFFGLLFVMLAFYSNPSITLSYDNPYGFEKLRNQAMVYIGLGELFSFTGFALMWICRDKSY